MQYRFALPCGGTRTHGRPVSGVGAALYFKMAGIAFFGGRPGQSRSCCLPHGGKTHQLYWQRLGNASNGNGTVQAHISHCAGYGRVFQIGGCANRSAQVVPLAGGGIPSCQPDVGCRETTDPAKIGDRYRNGNRRRTGNRHPVPEFDWRYRRKFVYTINSCRVKGSTAMCATSWIECLHHHASKPQKFRR